ncbi:hypothetical protein A3A09_01725 [Candidatus Nomurabacteria bacterium RIFCSPLOWO2_01_FULL_42_20]|nr:MAG: hypothetical protein A3A09_01725 [Candidatus Nomurabacteria bacterium RIFCSPLOWO2_01_FULL_42_20]
MLSFKPKQLTKKLMGPLNDRAHEVVYNRFGLGEDAERKTLEAIGKKYGITRERVRQIENAALNLIRKADEFKAEQASFEELRDLIDGMGAVVPEEDFLETLTKDRCVQNHIHLHLVLGDDFIKHKEDEYFKDRWTTDSELADQVHDSIRNLYESLSDEEIMAESDIVSKFLDHLKDVSEQYKKEEILKRWLSMSKLLGQNPLGEWGRADSPNVNVRGIRDYSYLVMKRHGSPMHFCEVAKTISQTFDKKAHTATCHNELIKDPRFVLVGRGTYGLSEWGYKPGVVRDVIAEILKKEGPMKKEEIIDHVMKERFLKKNTILVNLQNSKYFKKTKDGLYAVA